MNYNKISIAIIFSLSMVMAQSQTTDDSIKVESLMKQMTLKEKINMIHAVSSFNSGGVTRLNIPEIATSDGPHGVRLEHGRGWSELKNVEDSGTYLPVGVCLASTWNPTLGYAFGQVLGSEANYRGKDIILGPGVNIMRIPLNGRNFEYQSEDPYLAGKMAVGYVKGVQSEGISACVKHFLGNNQETNRGSINVVMSERALREIYLPAFKAAVQEGGVNSIMASYNKFRGEWMAENNYLLEQVLRKELGFKGVVMSDWGAAHHTMENVWNGLDLEMGSDLNTPPLKYNEFYMADTLETLVKNHQLASYYIDAKVRRILTLMAKTGMLDHSRKEGQYNTKEHQETAKKIAEEGIVLLKNDNNILPFSDKIKTVAVIGENAFRKNSLGGGSSQVKAFYEVTPLEGLKKILGKNVKVEYAQGYNIQKNATYNRTLGIAAIEAARKADVVIFVGGTIHGYDYNNWSDNAYDAEGIDKPNMELPFGQDSLIDEILKLKKKTAIVMIGGGPVDMSAWEKNANAILEAWYPGMEGGTALAEILFGKINPSGKLPVTFPVHLEDVPAEKLGQYPGDSANVYYNDDIYVGYRYYDTYHVKPLFAFGHGLSYTTFSYSNLSVQSNADSITITFSIKNTGNRVGKEIAQVYVHENKPSLPRPEQELKAFQKVELQPNQSKTISVSLHKNSFKYFNDIENEWILEKDQFDIRVGGSSDNLQLSRSISL